MKGEEADKRAGFIGRFQREGNAQGRVVFYFISKQVSSHCYLLVCTG